MSLRRNPNIFYGMGRRRVHRRRHYGGSFLSKVHDFIKQHKIISTVGNALGAVGVPYASAVGKAASVLGYGRRRRRVGRPRLRSSMRRVGRPRISYGTGRRRVMHRRRRGGDLKSILSSAHKFVKDKRLISSALSHFGHHKLASAASTLGYGRRRRRVHRRRGGNVRSILSSAHKFVKDKRLVSSALRHFLPHSNLHKAAHVLGYGRRRTVRRKPLMMHHRHYGGANFFSTEQIAAPKFS